MHILVPYILIATRVRYLKVNKYLFLYFCSVFSRAQIKKEMLHNHKLGKCVWLFNFIFITNAKNSGFLPVIFWDTLDYF